MFLGCLHQGLRRGAGQSGSDVLTGLAHDASYFSHAASTRLACLPWQLADSWWGWLALFSTEVTSSEDNQEGWPHSKAGDLGGGGAVLPLPGFLCLVCLLVEVGEQLLLVVMRKGSPKSKWSFPSKIAMVAESRSGSLGNTAVSKLLDPVSYFVPIRVWRRW